MKPAIQIMVKFDNQKDAGFALRAMQAQQGLLGVRVIDPSPEKPGWRLQAFMEPGDCTANTPLPEDCRFVLVPDPLLAAMNCRKY